MHKNIIVNYLSLFFAGLSGIFLNIFIISVYDSIVLGNFNFFLAFVIVLSQFCVGGIQFSVLKHNSHYIRRVSEVSSSVVSALFLSGIFTFFIIIILYLLTPLLNNFFDLKNFSQSIYLIIPSLLFFSLNKILLMSLNGLNLMQNYAFFNLLRYVLLLFSVVLFYNLGINVEYLISVFFISEFILFIMMISFMFFKVLILSLPKQRWIKRHFFFGLKGMWGGALMETNTRIDILMIGAFLGYGAVGVYSFASMVAEGFAQVYTILKNNVDPIFGKAYFKNEIDVINHTIDEVRKRYLIYLFGLGIVMIMSYKFIFINIFSLNKTMIVESWNVFIILTGLIMLSSFYRPFIGLLNQINQPEKFSQIIIFSVILNIILNIVLIPWLGIYGAAFSTGLVFFVESYLVYLFSTKHFLIKESYARKN
ncbi:polysaccharide biosynthesis C-terminal domain-containing protein [Halarcobacter bivalviorum]|nr:polysaccharide biosynthesis C-terminal domain-containing protein [Halarcobacter bivalviorum]AXH11884.1 polysaccharide biosynthesis protein [Halarcobacter bivalviorum]